MNSFLPYLMVLMAALIWGSLGTVAAYLNNIGFTGLQVGLMRMVFSACFVLCTLPMMHMKIRKIFHTRRLVVCHAMVGVVLYNIMYFTAISKIGVTLSVCILYTSPLWTLISAAVIFQNVITRAGLLAAVISIVGAALVIISSHSIKLLYFDFLAIGAAFIASGSYALYGVLGKKALQGGLKPLDILFTSLIISGTVAATVPEFWDAVRMLMHIYSPGPLIAVFMLSLVGTILSYFLFVTGLKHISPHVREPDYSIGTRYGCCTCHADVERIFQYRSGSWTYHDLGKRDVWILVQQGHNTLIHFVAGLET